MICIDPGINGCGLAEFVFSGALVRALYVPCLCRVDRPTMAERVQAMVVELANRIEPMPWSDAILLTERPQIYAHGKGKGDPNDLLSLAEICAGVAARRGRYYKWRTVSPREWKGSLNGDVMTKRIRAALTETERARVESYGRKGALDHNTYDAIGIGLWYLNRLTQKVYTAGQETQ